MAENWPLGVDHMRSAIGFDEGQDDATELDLFITAACERVDRETGRLAEPTRHEINGKVPADFVLVARALARLRWRQSKKGPKARPDAGDGEPEGFDLPRWIEGVLAKYPPRLYPPDAP